MIRFLFLVLIPFSLFASLKDVNLFSKGSDKLKYIGFYMAKEKGFYKEAGLNVNFEKISQNGNITNKILKTDNSFGVSDSLLVHDKMKGKDVVLLGAIFQHTPFILVSLKKSNIQKVKDLENKKIMIDITKKSNAILGSMLKKYEIEDSKIKLLPTSSSIKDLIDEKVDVYAVYCLADLYELEKLNIEYTFISPEENDFDFYDNILFASEKYVKENQKTVRDFYDASIKGWEYSFENIDEAISLMLSKYNSSNTTYDKYLFEFKKILALAEYQKGHLGKIELSKINHIINNLFLYNKSTDIDTLNRINIYSFLYQLSYEPQIVAKRKFLTQQNLLKEVQKPFYEMNSEQLKEIFENYLENSEIVAIQLYDLFLYNTVLSSWKDKKKIIHNDMRGFDNNFNKNTSFKSMDVFYEGNRLGTLTIYYKNLKKLSSLEHGYLLEKEEIRLCIDPKSMPFEGFDDDGNYIGITSGYFKIFEERLGVPIKVIKTESWNQSLEFAKQRRCDLLTAMRTKEREKYLNFTSSLSTTPVVIATRIDAPFIPYFEDLRNEKIGVPKSYAYSQEIKRMYPNLNTVEVDSIKDGLELVKKGKLYGQLGTLASIGYYFQSDFTGELKIAGKTDSVNLELAIGIRNDEPILFDIFQNQIDNLDDSLRHKISNDWINIKYEQKFDYSLLWKVLGVISIFFIAFIYRQYLLKKMNRRLTNKVESEVKKNREKDKLLYQQTKLASMGEMLNNIAHQWRQPLNAINSNVAVIDSIMMKNSFENEQVEQRLLEIENQTKYMSETIDSFRNYFNPRKKREIFFLTDIVDDSLSIIKYTLDKNNIKLYYEKKSDITIEGYLGECIQTVISIINNSVDAFRDNDTNKRELRIIIDKKIIIEDNAGGIDEEIIDRIFEPYFTTKQQSKGTGTGLYMSKMIVEKSMNGHLSVENIENGARFIIKL